MTDALEQERKSNSQWRLRTQFQGADYHQQLLENEFHSQEQIAERSSARLKSVLRHALRAVPYYRQLWREQGITRADLTGAEVLPQLPVTQKATLVNHAESLLATFPLSGQTAGGKTQTAGTTGQPTIVSHSQDSLAMFAWLKQRELRWFRVNPQQRLLSIRPSVDFPKLVNGDYLADGKLLKLPAWPYIGACFQTGLAWAYNATNPVTEQARILDEVKPGFIVMQASCLENLSMQKLGAEAVGTLQGANAISQTLTPAMRKQVQSALGVPVFQNYGLNEIGLVASQCREGGRYHSHSEHCYVELLREDGSPAEQGEFGRIVITALTNSIMPLVRYETGDMARVVAGPCPCGRNLPGFGEVLGRYRRLAYLPEGSYQRFSDIHLALYEFAERRRSALHRFQVYEYLSGAFEVRVDCDPAMYEELEQLIRSAYLNAWTKNEPPELTILRTDQFHGGGLIKFQIFMSEFFPDADIGNRKGQQKIEGQE